MEQLTKNQAVATSQEAVQNQNEPQLRDENAHNDKSVHGVRSEERFSRNAETDLVCRLLLEKKKDAEEPYAPVLPTARRRPLRPPSRTAPTPWRTRGTATLSRHPQIAKKHRPYRQPVRLQPTTNLVLYYARTPVAFFFFF